jgi:hypothetical protein
MLMTDTSPSIPMFRNLGQSEEEAFRLWARENYKPLGPISGIWHPVVQDECAKINSEASVSDALIQLTPQQDNA